MYIPPNGFDKYLEWYEERKDKYKLITGIKLFKEGSSVYTCGEMLYFNSLQEMKDYVHEKQLKVGTYEWEGRMTDPFIQCFSQDGNIDDYNE